MKTVFFIRHGQSMANAWFPTQDHTQTPLSDLGQQQAQEVADFFQASPELIVHSSFIRTKQTATPLMQKFPQVPVCIWDIHEFCYLNIARYKNSTIEDRRAPAKAYWEKRDVSYIDGEGAESFSHLCQRVNSVFDELAKTEAKNIVVFCHGHFLRTLFLKIEFPDASELELMDKFLNKGVSEEINNGSIWKYTYASEKNTTPPEVIFCPSAVLIK